MKKNTTTETGREEEEEEKDNGKRIPVKSKIDKKRGKKTSVKTEELPVQLPQRKDYPSMIIDALTQLNEPRGSSIRDITKQINLVYPDLPITHKDQVIDSIKSMARRKQLYKNEIHNYILRM